MSRHRAPEPEKSASDGVSPVMAAIAILCVLGLAVALVLMSGSDRVSGPMNVNGDFAGPESEESVSDYAARASESLGTPLPLADGSAPEEGAEHWALVSFDPPADADVAEAAVDGIEGLRVGTLYVGPMASRPIAEPTAGQSRADVIRAELDLIARAAGPVIGGGEHGITGLLVRAPLEQLRAIEGRPGVAAVEALAADAVYGRFGVRPLAPPEPVPAPDTTGAPR
ncbi:hypothetical protein FOB82_00615 [Corynebacterium xerosis]|uniref:Uncharacterized protein n=1 Tax=Corynebacterium xerosis TaxID=1725 RepID=A0A6B8TCR6_9CORY|nr:hypothetical protein [Corynebacterium xerosis]QGS33668.1 hypothetical protein FOB82_00615 [Corynebacterium xerosis]